MPSTYTLNNGIELVATGEQTGTWGDTTNLNLQIVDRGLDGQVTVTLGSAGTSGSPNTLAITDGVLSDGQNRMIIYTDGGDLGATAYVQLTPSDAEKILYIRNSLSASRSLIVFQGTYNASNDYEIPAGTTAVVFFDGAGAGAVAANVFNNAYFDGLTTSNVDINGGVIDGTTIGGSAPAAGTFTNLTASGTINLTGATTSNGGTVTTIDINGGTIDGTVIGGSTPAAITATTGTFSGDLSIADKVVHTGNTNTAIRFPAADTVTVETSGAERLRVTSTGTVGIGTTSPAATLDVAGTGALKVPVGTTAQRPTPATGQIRYNSDDGAFEGYDGTDWGAIGGGGGAPAGSIIWHAANTAPTGYLKANGAAVSRTTYAALFAAIGTTFGAGDGSTTFNLPDLRGEFIRGWDDARGVDSGRTFGSAQSDDNKSHTHTGSTNTTGSHAHSIALSGNALGGTNAAVFGNADGGSLGTSGAGSHSHTVTIDASGSEARPRNIALLACIKF